MEDVDYGEEGGTMMKLQRGKMMELCLGGLL
jgi:hypothetical protein